MHPSYSCRKPLITAILTLGVASEGSEFLATCPRPRDEPVADLERLQRDPGLSSLRPLLERWTDETHGSEDPDTDLLEEIRVDIARATKILKHSELLDRTGKVLTFLSLPVAVYDLLEGSALGTALVPIGPAIEAYKASRIRQSSWVRLGTV